MTEQLCKGGANGKICKTLNTERTSMSSYIKYLREEGYISLRDKHYESINAFPALGEDPKDTTQDPDIVDKEDQASNDNDDELDDNGTTADSTPKVAEEETMEDTVRGAAVDNPSTKEDDTEGDPTTGEPHAEKLQTPLENRLQPNLLSNPRPLTR